ncbi:initiation-specific alpha-1,6-mannosyltransferase [Naviculisporaceae sp. PSN 640]
MGALTSKLKKYKHDRGPEFPKKIWQIWKTDIFSLEDRDLNRARSWTAKNPDFRYELLNDHNDITYLEDRYGPAYLNRPDIVAFYRALNDTIIKADLLRYLVMYADGGVYADIDADALKPVHRFIPARYDQSEIDMVIGIEVDQPEFRKHPILGPKSMSFCQWTLMCKPRLPLMLHLAENVMSWLSDTAAKQGTTISDVALDFDGVISGTGPSAFTKAVLDHMNSEPLPFPITWSHFHLMDESKVVNRILVLGVEAFAAGQGHSDSGDHKSRFALVHHHYHASSWPSNHPRLTHPAYGEVESCNWKADCVKKWDDNVLAFNDLSPEDKMRLIEERNRELAHEREKEKEAEEQARKLEQLGLAEAKAQEEEERKREEYERDMDLRFAGL